MDTDTKLFLEKILPRGSVCIVATRTAKGFIHRGFSDYAEASQYIQQCDAKGVETYHACAGYKQVPFKDETGKFIARTSANWDRAKALWCDIDCGKDDGYPTQKEAIVALYDWCNKSAMPKPMLVNSGNGVHAYWLLTEEISPTTWQTMASKLKSAMSSAGLKVDPSRTADFSSILRPPGTHNHKNPNAPKPVYAATAGDPVSPDEIASRLDALVGSQPSVLQAQPWMQGAELTTFDMNGANQAPCSARRCAEKCKQMALMRDTQGNVSYEQWRGVIGIIKHCEEGIELAHEWTKRRAETHHAQLDTDVRFNTWKTGPTTCEYFLSVRPKDCEGCPHKGKITSPIQLGRPEVKPEVVEGIVESHEARGKVKIEVPALPPGFFWDEAKHVLWTNVYDKQKKEWVPALITSTRFFLYDRICDEFGEFYYRCRALFPRGVIRNFDLAGSLIGGSTSQLLGELAKYEVQLLGGSEAKGQYMQSYLRSSVTQLTKTTGVNRVYSHFGWQKDGSFVIGNRRYAKDGITEVLLGESASEKQSAFPTPIGTLEAYAERVNWIYNRDGMECMQYMICSLWAAPLVEFMEPTYNGIPCALTGADSGKGKTTAAQVALYAFGRAHPDLSLTGQRGATSGGQAKLLGILRNLPMLFDEVTNKSPLQLSQICYNLSNGVEDMRLKSSGGKVGFAERESWRTQTAMTGNADIAAKLSINGNSEAEAMRIFEIRTDLLDIPKLDPITVSMKVAEIADNTGAAGEVYIKYLIEHYDDLSKMIEKSLEAIKIDTELVSQPRYRFYRNHMACTLTAARIMKELGVIAFDLDKLCTFAINAVRDCFDRSEMMGTASDPIETIGFMLADFGGHVATTPTLDVPEGEELYKVTCPKGGLYARAIRANAAKKDEYDGLLFISSKEARDWCSDNRVPRDKLLATLKDCGALKDGDYRVTLGRGTTERTARQRCWVLYTDKIEIPEESINDSD